MSGRGVPPRGYRIAVVEDDPELGDYLERLLDGEGYDTALYPTPGRFFDSILRSRPDAVLLDMQLPGMDGKEIIRVLRADPKSRDMLIVSMSGRQKSTKDIVDGLHAGADEYFLKPLDRELLLVRVEVLLRRRTGKPSVEDSIRLGALTLFPERRVCLLQKREVKLTRLEFDLLLYLLRQRNRVLTRGALLEAVWHGDPTMTTRTVDKHVETLRRKLGSFGRRLQTVVRVGYVLKST
ncbi:MAG: response regulator transcription factor [Elusimicrobiota bacterium]